MGLIKIFIRKALLPAYLRIICLVLLLNVPSSKAGFKGLVHGAQDIKGVMAHSVKNL